MRTPSVKTKWKRILKLCKKYKSVVDQMSSKIIENTGVFITFSNIDQYSRHFEGLFTPDVSHFIQNIAEKKCSSGA